MWSKRLNAADRRAVEKRVGGRCEYCRSPMLFATEPFVMEHIWPRKKGGPTALDNMALSCSGCNNYKHARVQAMDPLTGARVPLYNPRHQGWAEHFEWDNGATRIAGKTDVGRATIECLRLNRMELVNLRRALVAVEEHPPQDEA